MRRCRRESPDPPQRGPRPTPNDPKVRSPPRVAGSSRRPRTARASSRGLRELAPRGWRWTRGLAKGAGRRREDRHFHLNRTVEAVAEPVFRFAHEDPDPFREDGGRGNLPAEPLHELRQPKAHAAALQAHRIQREGPRSLGDGTLDETIAISSARQVFPIGPWSPEADADGLRKGPDGRLCRREDHVHVNRSPVRPLRKIVGDRIDEFRRAGDGFECEESLRVVTVLVRGIQEVAGLGKRPRLPKDALQGDPREGRRNEPDRIGHDIHGRPSRYADGDSQPSPFASAWGIVSAQLSTY